MYVFANYFPDMQGDSSSNVPAAIDPTPLPGYEPLGILKRGAPGALPDHMLDMLAAEMAEFSKDW